MSAEMNDGELLCTCYWVPSAEVLWLELRNPKKCLNLRYRVSGLP